MTDDIRKKFNEAIDWDSRVLKRAVSKQGAVEQMVTQWLNDTPQEKK